MLPKRSSMYTRGDSSKHYSPERVEEEFSEVRGSIPHRMRRLPPCTAGTKSFVSTEEGRPGRALACEGGMRHGRRQAQPEAHRLYRGRPRPRTERLHHARLDDLHHRRSRDRTDSKAPQGGDRAPGVEAARAS